MSKLTLGIIGGGQLGSMLAEAAKKIEIKTIIFSDNLDDPAKYFSDEFIFGKYNDEQKINESKIYNKENETFPSFINSTVSIEKAEKVVKDPKRPIIIKYFRNNSEISLLSR